MADFKELNLLAGSFLPGTIFRSIKSVSMNQKIIEQEQPVDPLLSSNRLSDVWISKLPVSVGETASSGFEVSQDTGVSSEEMMSVVIS